ncbi:MAG: hypothetical protein ABIR47_17265, partial [Candidatus Kapaibacterium sp.]
MKKTLSTCTGSALGLVLLSGIAAAQIPQQISYQGLATNPQGIPLPNSTSNTFTFKIYDQANSTTPIWTETQSNVVINKGLFNVILGSVNPLTVPFTKPYYLGTTINGGNEVAPRTQFTTAPYSFRSLWADSAAAVAVNAISSENIRNGAVTLSKIDPTGSTAGQVLTSTGTGLAWQIPASTGGAGVASINGQSGVLTFSGAGGATITHTGNNFTIWAPSGVSSINSADGAIAVTNPTGPGVTLSLVPFGITEPLLGDEAVTTRKIKDGAVTGAKIANGTIGGLNIADNSITSPKIVDGSIQNVDLANSTITINTGSGLSGGGVVPLGGTLNLANTGVLSVTGTPNQINVSNATGNVTISTPQNIAPTSSPTFQGLTLTGKATSASTSPADPGNTLVTKDYLTGGNVAVITNASLIGNGTNASPLGINLGNANTYTATQTFPVTAAQGDALIGATNAGTAFINPVRIANGLTDAQVNDNLTIAAGTINNTPIGATTPNTGAFTAITGASLALSGKGTSASTIAADPGTTLVTKDFVTTSGNVAVSTNTSLVGNGTTASPLGINLANANTFSATQTFPASAPQGDALITSTNVGTTTINAVRIGNGLTDAQVNDNLTIAGGTVNNTPIGATTPNTGAFTTINGTSLALTAKGTSASTAAADAGNTLVTKDFVT